MTTEQVKEKLQGAPGSQVQIWREGMEQWTDARTLPEFAPPQPSSAPASPPPKQAPAPPGPAIRHPKPVHEGQDLRNQAGFFKALFDFRFDDFVTQGEQSRHGFQVNRANLVAVRFVNLVDPVLAS